jgi:hypothetical protein
MRRTVVLTFAAALIAMILAAPAASWAWPAGGQVIRAFSLGDDPYAGGQHRGVDIAGEAGSSVLAPAAGTVSFAGSVPGSGRTVTIRTSDGYAVTLVGLGSIGVAKNALLSEGEPVGTIAVAPGDGTPANVHLGVRIASDPDGYLDPLTFLPARTEQPVVGDPAVEEAAPAAVAESVPATVDETQGSSEPVAEVPPSGGQANASSDEGEAVSPSEQLSMSGTPAQSPAFGNAAAVTDLGGAVQQRSREVAGESSSTGGGTAPVSKTHARGGSSEIDTVAAFSTARLKHHNNVGAATTNSVSRSTPVRTATHSCSIDSRWILLPALLVLLLGAAGGSVLAAARVHRSRRPPRMMLSPEGDAAGDERERDGKEDPGCSGLAVCQRPAPYWARRRVRRPVGHLRSLSPAQRQRRPDGERHRRARDARHGRGRERRALIA